MNDKLFDDLLADEEEYTNDLIEKDEQNTNDLVAEVVTSTTKKTYNSRARVTANDMFYLAFLSMFPFAKTEDLARLRYRETNRFTNDEAVLVSEASMLKRLYKLRRLGAVTYEKCPRTSEKLWCATQLGHEYASLIIDRTLDFRSGKTLSINLANHTQTIAHVASELVSPKSKYLDKPIKIEHLYSEKYIGQAFKFIQTKGGQWADTRKEVLKEAKDLISKGVVNKANLWDTYPSVMAIAVPEQFREHGCKAVLYPDLAFISTGGDRVMAEIELSVKSLEEYKGRLVALNFELNKCQLVYDKVIYFTDKKRVATLLKQADEILGFRLLQSGKLEIKFLENKIARNFSER